MARLYLMPNYPIQGIASPDGFGYHQPYHMHKISAVTLYAGSEHQAPGPLKVAIIEDDNVVRDTFVNLVKNDL